MNEDIIDQVNNLYVTRTPGQPYYKLYRDKELIHTHTKHISDTDAEESVTVYSMVHSYWCAHYKQLEQKLKNRTDREVKALMSEHCNDDLLLRPARDHTPIGIDSGVSWYWSENSDPSDPL